MRGDALRPLHGLPVGIKDLEETAGLRTTYGSPIFRDYVPGRGLRHGGPHPRRRRHRHRQDQHAGIRRRRQYPQRGLWRDRQPLRPYALGGRLLRRLGGGAGDRHGAALLRLRYRRQPAQPGGLLRHRRLPPERRAWCRPRSARMAGRRCRCWGRWRATCRMPACCSRPWPPTMRATRWPIRCMPGRCVASRRCSTRRGGSTWPRCGWPSPRISARRRPSSWCARPSPRPASPHRAAVRPAPRTAHPDCTGGDEAFEVLRAAGLLAAHLREGAHPAAGLRPEHHRQCRGRAALPPGGRCPRQRPRRRGSTAASSASSPSTTC